MVFMEYGVRPDMTIYILILYLYSHFAFAASKHLFNRDSLLVAFYFLWMIPRPAGQRDQGHVSLFDTSSCLSCAPWLSIRTDSLMDDSCSYFTTYRRKHSRGALLKITHIKSQFKWRYNALNNEIYKSLYLYYLIIHFCVPIRGAVEDK